jgi:hypothetical protein
MPLFVTEMTNKIVEVHSRQLTEGIMNEVLGSLLSKLLTRKENLPRVNQQQKLI